MVDLLQLQNRSVLFEYVGVLVVRSRSFSDNVHMSGAFVLINEHQVLIGDRIFDYIAGMEWKLDQD